MAGGAGGLARDWLHRGVHQLVADRGVHSDFVDGRRAGPLVSGVRHRAVGGDSHLHAGVADHHAHDVCGLVATNAAPAGTATGVLGPAVPALTGLVAAPSARAVADLGSHGGLEHQPLPKHSQRFFPTAGHGPNFWLDPRRPKQFLSVGITGLSNGALYALIALGYTLVYGIIELINFAHGDLFMLGAVFSYFFLTSFLDAKGASSRNWGMLALTLVAVMAFCAAFNVIIERLAYRRLRDAPKLAPLITAVGVSFILQFVGLKWNGSAPRNFETVVPQQNWVISGVTVPYRAALVIGITIPLLIALVTLVNKTKQGKAMRATAQDKDAARLMGIDVNKTISFTFALGGAMAGAAGLMYAQSMGMVAYNLGFQLGLIAFTSAVLGGVGNLNGAVLGGFLIGLVQGLNDGLPFALGQKWSQSLVFAILILLMVYRPAGLLGKATVEKV